MRFKILIVLMLCAVTHLAAQQLYTDTFKLQDMNQTVDADALLLDMIAAQTAELYANDSTADTREESPPAANTNSFGSCLNT